METKNFNKKGRITSPNYGVDFSGNSRKVERNVNYCHITSSFPRVLCRPEGTPLDRWTPTEGETSGSDMGLGWGKQKEGRSLRKGDVMEMDTLRRKEGTDFTRRTLKER